MSAEERVQSELRFAAHTKDEKTAGVWVEGQYVGFVMERLHLRPHQESGAGRDCRFCRQSEADFEKRAPIDRLICAKHEDVATGHVSENGYIRHRILEIESRLATA